MKEVVRIFMKEQLGVNINTDNLAGEAVELYLEELDVSIVPKEIQLYLPDPVIFETYLFEEEAEWIIGIALDATTNIPLYLVCLKDREKVYSQLL